MTGTCPPRHCACGRCYSPGSLVGDWLREQSRRAVRALRGVLLRRPDRFPRDPDGGVAVPEWVVAALGQSRGTR